MKRRMWVLGSSILFYIVMAALTLGSRKAYLASLAPVVVGRPKMSWRMVDGNAVSVVTLPEELAGLALFKLERTVVNGETRFVAREIPDIEYGEPDEDGNVAVIGEIGSMDVLVLDGGKALSDGKGVKVLNEEDLPSWWE